VLNQCKRFEDVRLFGLLRFRMIPGRPGVLLADSKAKWRKVLLHSVVAKGRYVVEKLKSVIRSSDGGQM
jgi:hypothetical protein